MWWVGKAQMRPRHRKVEELNTGTRSSVCCIGSHPSMHCLNPTPPTSGTLPVDSQKAPPSGRLGSPQRRTSRMSDSGITSGSSSEAACGSSRLADLTPVCGVHARMCNCMFWVGGGGQEVVANRRRGLLGSPPQLQAARLYAALHNKTQHAPAPSAADSLALELEACRSHGLRNPYTPHTTHASHPAHLPRQQTGCSPCWWHCAARRRPAQTSRGARPHRARPACARWVL